MLIYSTVLSFLYNGKMINENNAIFNKRKMRLAMKKNFKSSAGKQREN